MKQDDFEKQMDNLNLPEIPKLKHQDILKVTLLKARKSAFMGVWMIVIPLYFLFCVFMKYYFKWDLAFFDRLEEMLSELDKTPGMKFISPVILVGLPILAIVLNFLAISFFQYDKTTKELNITFKIKLFNILILLAASAIVFIFLLYAISENFKHGSL